jgi:hypothetical protein
MGRAGWARSLWTRPAQTRSGRPLPLTATQTRRHLQTARARPPLGRTPEITMTLKAHVAVPNRRNQCLPKTFDGPEVAIGVTQRTKRFWMMQLLMQEEVSHRCQIAAPLGFSLKVQSFGC